METVGGYGFLLGYQQIYQNIQEKVLLLSLET